MFSGMILAVLLSCAALIVSRTRWANATLTRKIAQIDAELADLTEKQLHLTKLFKKQAARVSQRERRDRENGSTTLDNLSGEDWKREFRKKNLQTIALNKGR